MKPVNANQSPFTVLSVDKITDEEHDPPRYSMHIRHQADWLMSLDAWRMPQGNVCWIPQTVNLMNPLKYQVDALVITNTP